MNKSLLSLTFLITFLLTSCEQMTDFQKKVEKKLAEQKEKTKAKQQPITFKLPLTWADSAIIDDYHGKLVEDPFRRLENDHAPDTKKWVKKQNQATFAYLNQLPFRSKIQKRLQDFANYKRPSIPFKKGNLYYFFNNKSSQSQASLYSQESLNDEATIVLNPNQFSEDGSAILGNYAFNKDHNLLAYQVVESDTEWRTIYIKNILSDQLLADKIDWVKHSNIAWYKDGFFYSRYPEPEGDNVLTGKEEFHQIYYHKLGDPQSKDELIFADRAFPDRRFTASTTADEEVLLIQVTGSSIGNALYFKTLDESSQGFVPITEQLNHHFQVIDHLKNQLLVLTNHKAPNNRVLLLHQQKPTERYWEEIIPESEDQLKSIQILGGKIVAHYIHNASSQLKIFDFEGRFEKEIPLPSIGTIRAINGTKDDSIVFYDFESFTNPGTIYQLDLKTNQSTIYKTTKINFDPAAYVTKQVWYKSYDGTSIPLFIIHKKGIKLDQKRPTLIYGFGGFNISILPKFNLTRLNLSPIFLENGGVFAVANIRGGGEFGKAWHEAGKKVKKQNAFNDFHAAAEYLIDHNYTSSSKIAIYGRSNGGLLVGGCITQRPDLYRVALPAGGILDMLRYDKFTIGQSWSTEYGVSANPNEFDYLLSYSPLHNTLPSKYPATLITTTNHDKRVVPGHSFKFAAALQANQKGKQPILIRVETNGGKPITKKIEEATDVLSFTFYNLREKIK